MESYLKLSTSILSHYWPAFGMLCNKIIPLVTGKLCQIDTTGMTVGYLTIVVRNNCIVRIPNFFGICSTAGVW